MIDVNQAIKFCERLAKDPEFNKQYADDGEFDMQDIVDMLNEYNYMKDNYGKYEFICDRMSSDEINELENALKEWERTWPQVEQFCSRNNLPLVWLNLTLDQMMYGVCFPEIQLNQSQLDNRGKQVHSN